jgi:hypothetical protein
LTGILEMKENGLLPRLKDMKVNFEPDGSGVVKALEALGIDVSSLSW